MNKRSKNIIYSGKQTFRIGFQGSEERLQDFYKKINFSITGSENANKYNENGELVAAFPKEVDETLRQYQANVRGGKSFTVAFDVTDHGEFINVRIVKE